MKVDPHSAQPAPTARAQRFTQLLREGRRDGRSRPAEQRPPSTRLTDPRSQRAAPALATKDLPSAKTTGAVRATALTTAASVQAAGVQRQAARARANVEAERLTAVRVEHHEASAQGATRAVQSTEDQAQRVDRRVLGLILQELEAAFDRDPPRVERAVNTDGKAPPFSAEAPPTQKPPVNAPARAEQAVALIERIETFVRSSRPALAVTLNNSLGARVEIERLGPGQIALKVVGQRGPPSADTVARIREELQACGLKVGALSVA